MWTWKLLNDRQVVLIWVTGAFAGVLAHSIFGPNQGPFEPALQAAIVATLGALLTASLAYVASRIGARAAEEAATQAATTASLTADKDREAAQLKADQDRKATQEAELRARKFPLFEAILDRAVTHQREVQNQFGWWMTHSGESYPGKPPVINPTDPIQDAAHKLYAFARQDTGDLADRLYRDLVQLDEEFCFDEGIHVDDERVAVLSEFKMDAFDFAMARIDEDRTELMRAIRSELGLKQLVDKPSGTRLPLELREID